MSLKLKKKMFTYKEAFGPGFPDHLTIEGYEPNPYTPKLDPNWVWPKGMLLDLCILWTNGEETGEMTDFPEHTFISGYTGTGKSSAMRNFCAALNIPYYEKTMSREFDFLEIESDRDLVNGNTLTHYGLLPMAMGVLGYPGCLVLSELDRVDNGALTPMYEVFEGQPYTMRTGGRDLIEPSPGFFIVGNGNTAMMGDPNGLYGSSQQDLALVERFTNKLFAEYPEEAVERSILAKICPQLDETIRNVMVDVANDIRAMHMGISEAANALPITMSTRLLIAWGKKTWAYRGAEANGGAPMRLALDRVLLNATTGHPEWHLALTKVINGRLGDPDE